MTVFLAACAGASVFFAQAQQPAQQAKSAAKGFVQGRLTWFDRQGKVAGTSGEPGEFRTLSISHDGNKAAVERTDPQTQNRDIWLIDIAGNTTTRFTSDPGWDAFPTWSLDDSRIIFTSNRAGQFDLYQKAANGTGEEQLLYKSEGGKGPTSWSPDGRFLIYYTLGQPTHVTVLPLAPADRKPIPLIDTQFTSITARFSPDGRWIAYGSNESGKTEVSVRSWDAISSTAGKPTVITSNGGRYPLWRRDGKEILFMSQDGMAMSMELDANTKVPTGAPKPLFKVPAAVLFWDVSPDGTKFLLPAPTQQ